MPWAPRRDMMHAIDLKASEGVVVRFVLNTYEVFRLVFLSRSF